MEKVADWQIENHDDLNIEPKTEDCQEANIIFGLTNAFATWDVKMGSYGRE